MAAVISFLVIFLVSVGIVKIASIMLRHTGMSEDMARFQARSAFTGTGFTTGESEAIVRHPVRRRIIMNLMFLGNVGIVSFMSTLILTLTSISDQRDMGLKLGILLGGVLFLLLLSRTGLIDWILGLIVRVFLRRSTRVYAHDYDNLLFLDKNYEVARFPVKAGSWLEGKTMEALQLNAEGVLVLGIRRDDGYYVAVPRGVTPVFAGDEIIAYGREQSLQGLMQRPSGPEGDEAHRQGVDAQRRLEGRSDNEKAKAGTVISAAAGGLGKRIRRLFGSKSSKKKK